MKITPPNAALRGVGLFDLFVTAILAVPGLADAFIALIDLIGTRTGLTEPLPPFPALAMFLINLAGVLGVCWNLMILRTRSEDMLRVNIVARWGVAALIVYYVSLRNMTPVLLIFVVSEIFGSFVETWSLRRNRSY